MKKVLLFTMAVCLAGTLQATIVIDDYTSTNPAGGWYMVSNGATQTKSETGLSGVYGGSRYTTYYSDFAGAAQSMAIEGGRWSISNGGTAYGKGTLLYNGGGVVGGLALNLTSGTKFLVDTYFDHVAFGKNTVLSITLNDGVQAATVSKTWTATQIINVQQTETFLFSSFLSQNPLLNLGSIDSIQLYLETDKAGDYALVTGFVTDAIPEPATMLLLGIGGLLLRKRS